MTEAEWLTSAEPMALLELVRKTVSQRKLRLTACAACRSNVPFSGLPTALRLVEAAERLADGHASLAEVTRTFRDLSRSSASPTFNDDDGLMELGFCAEDAEVAALCTLAWASDDEPGANREDCDRIRCIFGNPFRPVAVNLAWLSPTVVQLAGQMYDARDFSAMPILADAMQDAGCDDAAVLDHCREPGPHARGCWVVDLVTGRA